MMMNVSRRAAFGGEDMNDITNKSQIYIEFDFSKKIVYNIFTEYGKAKSKSNKDFKHSVIKIFIGSQLCHYLAIGRRKPFELLGTP